MNKTVTLTLNRHIPGCWNCEVQIVTATLQVILSNTHQHKHSYCLLTLPLVRHWTQQESNVSSPQPQKSVNCKEPTDIKATPLSFWNHYLAKNLLTLNIGSPLVSSLWWMLQHFPFIPREPLSSHPGCVVCHIVKDDDGIRVEPTWPLFFSFSASFSPSSMLQ